MDWHFINTDKNRQSQDEWIRRGIAVATDNETLRARLANIPAGDRLLMYVNKEGVLAVGEVLSAGVIDVREKSAMVNSNEVVEFHKAVRWILDLRGNPLPYWELPRFAGVQPVQTLQRLEKGKDWVLQRLRGLAGAAGDELLGS
jgi:hypothetical protein